MKVTLSFQKYWFVICFLTSKVLTKFLDDWCTTAVIHQ